MADMFHVRCKAPYRMVAISAYLLAAIGPGAISSAADSDCVLLSERITAKIRAGLPEEAAQLFKQVEARSACTSSALVPLGHNVAVSYGQKAFSGRRSEQEQAQLLRAGLFYGRPWQLVASLADLEKAGQRYAEAVALYQEALDAISDETCTGEERDARPQCRDIAPEQSVVEKIYARAIEARMLAERYVPAPKTRSGEPGGLARRTFRGFTPRTVALPIQFTFNSTEFTTEGRKAVEDMLTYLMRQGAPAIRLVGHADERGTDEFNQKLSVDRAGAVRRYLQAGGYKGAITAHGRGRSEPFKTDDPGSYTEEQHWQLDRRVELIR